MDVQMTDAKTSKTKAGPGAAAGKEPGTAEPVAAQTPAPAVPETPAETGIVAADELQADIAAVNDRLLRLQADFDNFRKRTARERSEFQVRAIEDLVRELLPVVDHFEMGLATAFRQGLDPAVHQGLGLVLDQLRAALSRFGLSPVDAVGKPFDPNLQESVAMMPSETHPQETVVEETRRGYTLGGRLLRAAQVVLSSGPAVAAGTEAPHA